MHEIPALDLEGDLVDGIEQVGDTPGQGIFDQRHPVDIGRFPQIDRHHGSCRLELGVQGSHPKKVLEDTDELAEV